MRVLWMCNRALSGDGARGTGGWLDAMADALDASGRVHLGIVAPGPVASVTRRDSPRTAQWLVPMDAGARRDGLPPADVVEGIVKAALDFVPDLVHSWGTEMYWGLLPVRGVLRYPALLETQGLKGPYAKVYYGALSFGERLRCVGIKELLTQRTMRSGRLEFARWGPFEQEIIAGHPFVDIQSPWTAAHVAAVNPDARLFHTDLVLRQSFYDAKGWQGADHRAIFCSSAYPVPYKGLHVAIRALARLRRHIPDACLRIAGEHQKSGLRQDGYVRWLNRLVTQLGLEGYVKWLGPLNAEQLVIETERAAATLIPTFIENCCTAMQEAMALGAPVVASYVGGIPSLGKEDESCLFFPPGDETMCAYQLERVLTDADLARRLSAGARQIAAVRNDPKRIVQRQIEIYEHVIASSRPAASPGAPTPKGGPND